MTYFRRLWAAALGREYLPLEAGARIAFRAPVGTITMRICSYTHTQSMTGSDSLVIEAKPLSDWMQK